MALTRALNNGHLVNRQPRKVVGRVREVSTIGL